MSTQTDRRSPLSATLSTTGLFDESDPGSDRESVDEAIRTLTNAGRRDPRVAQEVIARLGGSSSSEGKAAAQEPGAPRAPTILSTCVICNRPVTSAEVSIPCPGEEKEGISEEERASKRAHRLHGTCGAGWNHARISGGTSCYSCPICRAEKPGEGIQRFLSANRTPDQGRQAAFIMVSREMALPNDVEEAHANDAILMVEPIEVDPAEYKKALNLPNIDAERKRLETEILKNHNDGARGIKRKAEKIDNDMWRLAHLNLAHRLKPQEALFAASEAALEARSKRQRVR